MSACLMYSVMFAMLATAVSSPPVKVDESFDELSDDKSCPDPEVRFYLFTRFNVDERQLIYIDDTWEASNLSASFFNPQQPSKIIIHGFRSDMFLTPLFEMKTEYLQRDAYNIFYVDWSNISSSLWYPAVVHNIQHVGACTAQLVNRIRDAGAVDIHVIGFSLGAQVTNFIANNLRPDYLLPRITGLDPAFPLFVTTNKEHKLDPTDAQFVDVFHCNGLMQGQIERTGHVDFYMNGGIYQPGCANHISTCSHERCAVYFMESIRSTLGFYGWQCQSYFNYIFGLCPYAADDITMAGEDCQHSSRGMNLVKTNSVFPFARGRFDEDISRARSVELNINDDYQAVMNYLSAKGFTKDANETAYRDMLKALGFRNQIIPKVLIIKEN